jgi:hypothetical protein
MAGLAIFFVIISIVGWSSDSYIRFKINSIPSKMQDSTDEPKPRIFPQHTKRDNDTVTAARKLFHLGFLETFLI